MCGWLGEREGRGGVECGGVVYGWGPAWMGDGGGGVGSKDREERGGGGTGGGGGGGGPPHPDQQLRQRR